MSTEKLVSLNKLSKQLMWFSTQECKTDRVFKDSRNFVMYKKMWCKKPRFIFIQVSKVIDSCWNKGKVLSKCYLNIYVFKILQITPRDLIRQVTGNKIGFFSQVLHDTRIHNVIFCTTRESSQSLATAASNTTYSWYLHVLFFNS